MKTKKLFLPAIFLAVTLIAYIACSIIFCYETKPAVAEGEFPFTITYEYKGETRTFSGVLKAKFGGSRTILGEHSRYWEPEIVINNPYNPEVPQIIDENEELMTSLTINENMEAGYFMGDPLQKDYYLERGLEGPVPRAEYYDYKNDISLNEENADEILESIGFKFIDFTYPEPIENSFSYAGVQYEADNLSVFVLVMTVFFLACLIFVRKEKEYTYSVLDKVSIGTNFAVGILAIPFITLMCFLFGIVESSIEIINQITYNMPSFAILCLTLSIIFRRKGYSKTGFYIQFVGIVPFVLLLVADGIYRMI